MIAVRWSERLGLPLGWLPRAALVAMAAGVALALALPLWTMSFESNQYPDPLGLAIHADKLVGQKTPGRDDLVEINTLNHYIGMRSLDAANFPEFSWLPLALAALALIALRAAVLGTLRDAVDLAMLTVLFGGYSAYAFGRRLWEYGHVLSPEAPIKVEPFTPPFFGRVRIANFWVESYPGPGGLALTAAIALAVLALVAAVWQARQSRTALAADAGAPGGP